MSLRHFQNCNMPIINHFRKYGVEDELDQLKIDRLFIRDILVDVTSGAIARTVISLSRVMGLSVIAEGVETEQQREFLAGLGCHSFQGYLFSRPLPVEELEAWSIALTGSS